MAATLRALTTETAVSVAPAGAGRKPDRRTEAADLRDDLHAHVTEALALCDRAEAGLPDLVTGSLALSPRHYQIAIGLSRLIASYRRKHTPDEAV